MRVAVVQLNAANNRSTNLENALKRIDEAAGRGAAFVLLPEYATFVGGYEDYPANAEPVPGPSTRRLADKARQHGLYLHCGSLIESSPDPGRFYNTSVLFDPSGAIMATYRKMHLFDIDVPGEVTEMESRIVIAGKEMVVANLPEFRLGLSICFDLRFPEMYRALAGAGAEVLVIPSAFAQATGRVHWEILLRARAIENHAFVLAACQHGLDAVGHPLYGHSMIVDPWGAILAEAPGEGDAVLVEDIDPGQVTLRRNQIQVLKARRPELYAIPPLLV